MKQIKLYILFFLLLISSQTALLAQCNSYSSTVPPPYPEDSPCMQDVFAVDPMCCNVEFDNMCKSILKTQCDVSTFDNGIITNCYQDPLNGNPTEAGCESRTAPFNGFFCEIWNVEFEPSMYPLAAPPRTDPNDPSTALEENDPCVLELQLFDANCCCCGECQMGPGGCDNTMWSGWDICCRLSYDDARSSVGSSNGFLLNLSTYMMCGRGLGMAEYDYLCDDTDPTTIDFGDPEIGCINVRLNEGTLLLNISLEGTANAGTTSNNSVPINQPFSSAPWNFTDAISTTPAVLGANNILDWVLIDFIDAVDGTTLIGQTVGLVSSNSVNVDFNINGQPTTVSTNVFSPDGTTGIKISPSVVDLTKAYLLKIRTINHVDILATNPVIPLSHSDFTQAGQVVAQEDQMTLTADGFSLKAGDINGDGIISAADFNIFILEVGNCTGNCSSDLDRDGDVDQDDFNLLQSNMAHIGIAPIRYE